MGDVSTIMEIPFTYTVDDKIEINNNQEIL